MNNLLIVPAVKSTLAALALAVLYVSPSFADIINWKLFPTPSEVFYMRAATLGSDGWTPFVVTNMSPSPNFTKAYASTEVLCSVMADVETPTAQTVNVAIAVDDGTKWRFQQALYSPANAWTTFAFQNIWVNIPAGKHTVMIWMQSNTGAPAWFSATEVGLICYEMDLPPPEP